MVLEDAGDFGGEPAGPEIVSAARCLAIADRLSPAAPRLPQVGALSRGSHLAQYLQMEYIHEDHSGT
jgi:hypothetical protein